MNSSPKEMFDGKVFNPDVSEWVNDWHIVGTAFAKAHIQHEGLILTGIRQLLICDYASNFHMHYFLVLTPPTTTKGSDVITLLDETYAKYEKPRKGIVLSHSVWYSSLQLFGDSDTAPRGEFLNELGVSFGPMKIDEQNKISEWAKSKGLRCEFNADEMDWR